MSHLLAHSLLPVISTWDLSFSVQVNTTDSCNGSSNSAACTSCVGTTSSRGQPQNSLIVVTRNSLAARICSKHSVLCCSTRPGIEGYAASRAQAKPVQSTVSTSVLIKVSGRTSIRYYCGPFHVTHSTLPRILTPTTYDCQRCCVIHQHVAGS